MCVCVCMYISCVYGITYTKPLIKLYISLNLHSISHVLKWIRSAQQKPAIWLLLLSVCVSVVCKQTRRTLA